jgi:membrane fusion protein (multidrug efflux system)
MRRIEAMNEKDMSKNRSQPAGTNGFLKKNRRLIKRMVIMLVLVGLLFGGIFGFKLFTARMIQKAMSAYRQPPVTISTVKAGYQTWLPRLQATGTTRAVRGVDVTTEIPGLVVSLNFKSGEEVKNGQILVRLNADADMARLHALQAEAELARTNLDRDRQQFAVKAISRETLDIAVSDLKNKEALVGQQAAVVAKKTIRAPFAGRLGISTVNPGQYLNPGNKIVTLQDIRSILVDFLVPQDEISRLTVGQPVKATTDTYPGREFEGKTTVISPAVDPRTRNIQIEASIDNPEGMLLPGMFVVVDIQIDQPKQYLTLPQTAVASNPYGDTVYIIESKGKDSEGQPLLVARRTFVTLGETRGDQVAVLKGIEEGDQVVSAGQQKLKNGSPVAINNQIQPSNQKAPQPQDS